MTRRRLVHAFNTGPERGTLSLSNMTLGSLTPLVPISAMLMSSLLFDASVHQSMCEIEVALGAAT